MLQDWPQEGVVAFNKYATRYREGLDLVVKDINIYINSGEKVGCITLPCLNEVSYSAHHVYSSEILSINAK